MSTLTLSGTFIDEIKIREAIERTAAPSKEAVMEVLSKGLSLKGLGLEETAVLLNAKGEEAREAIFDVAAHIKETIYGDRLVFFAPLYLSNYCVNDCGYCGFHSGNRSERKKLTSEEIRSEVERLIEMGHKRLLLEAGEDPANNPIEYVLDAIDTIYSVRTPRGEIRRLNVNIAATSVENYRRLKDKGIGTYQLFQETYHRETFGRLHRGPKADYLRQLYAMDKAFEAGIDDVGLGVLFGLYDWRFEVLALVSHAEYLSAAFGVGPHTISVPRFRPAPSVGYAPAFPVSDEDFLKLIAVLRIAVPYVGMIITTRESPGIRETAFRIGISQTSAASTTTPGGFALKGREGRGVEQFSLSDKRTLDEIAISVMKQGYTPSFCTACYRKKRTGSVFTDLARPGDIHEFCAPNSILTLLEYLEDIASPESRALGLEIIRKTLDGIENPAVREATEKKIERIKKGERDLYF